jgi:outer membrane lipoprotein-sorting protein
MKNKIKILLIIYGLLICPACSCVNCRAFEPNDGNLPEQKEIIKIIEKLNQTANSLKNLSAQIEYTHAQPLFETRTVRAGRLFYVKDANATLRSTSVPHNTTKDESALSSKATVEDGSLRSTSNSALRINFLTIKQDDSAEQNYREDYVFDGAKLVKIDYQSKSATSEQLAKDNAIEPFELVQDYFPIIGLAKPDELAQQFDIKLQQKPDKQNFTTLLLTPKENSRFFKTYKQVEIKIDSKNFLPYAFSALTCEDEKITIKLSQIDISAAVKRGVFDVVIPADFVQMQK